MSSRVRQVARNALYLLLEKSIVLGTTFGIFVFLARGLGQSGLGRYTFSFGLVSFFGVFTDMGINVVVVREVARAPRQADVYASTVMPLKGTLGLIVLAALLAIVGMSDYSPEISRSVLLFALALMLNGMGETFNSIFKGFQRMSYSTLIVALVQGVLFVGCGLAVYYRQGVIGIAWAYVAARFFHLVVAGCLYRSFHPRGRRAFDPRLGLHLSKTTVFNLPASYFLLNLFNLSAIALFYTRGDAEVGAFGAASKLCGALFVLATSFSEALFPMIAREFGSAPDSIRIAYERAVKYFVLLMIPVLAAMMLFSGEILYAVYGPEYRGSFWTLRILLGFVPIATLCALCHYLLVAVRKERFGFWTLCATIVLGFPLNLYLSSRIGRIGAALACLILSFVLVLALYIYIRERLFSLDPKNGLIKPVACGIFMSFSMYLLRSASSYIALSTGVTIYAILLWATRTLCRRDVLLFREILRARRT